MTQQDVPGAVPAAAADPGPVPCEAAGEELPAAVQPLITIPGAVVIPAPMVTSIHAGIDRLIKDLAEIRVSGGQAGTWERLVEGLLTHLPSMRDALAGFLEREVTRL